MSMSGLSYALSTGMANPYAKLVLIALGDSCDPEDGRCYCSWQSAAEMAGTTLEHVVDLLDALVRSGHITEPENPLEGQCPIFESTDYIICYLVSQLKNLRTRSPHPTTYKKQPIPIEIRSAVYERDGDQCHYCQSELAAVERTLDHKEPESKGGLASLDNLVVCCRRCNSAKGTKSYSEFMKWVGSK